VGCVGWWMDGVGGDFVCESRGERSWCGFSFGNLGKDVCRGKWDGWMEGFAQRIARRALRNGISEKMVHSTLQTISAPHKQRPTTRPTGRAASRRNSIYVVINLGMKRKERTVYVVGRTTPIPTAARRTTYTSSSNVHYTDAGSQPRAKDQLSRTGGQPYTTC
jgi:hypothetical protein